jgi:TonB family protein
MLLAVLTLIALSAAMPGNDRVCGRVVSIMCESGSGPTLDLNLDSSPFTDPVRVEISVPQQERAPLFDLLERKVCATGTSQRKGNRRVLTVSSATDVEPPKNATAAPQLPPGVVRACAPGVSTPPTLQTVPPKLPPDALSRGVQGMMVVELIVGPDGSVQAARAARRIDAALDAAVLAAFKQWRFGQGSQPVALFLEFSLSVR